MEKDLKTRKRESNRKFSARAMANAEAQTLEVYINKTYGVTVEEYVTDDFQEKIKSQTKSTTTTSISDVNATMDKIEEIVSTNMNSISFPKGATKPMKSATAIDRLFSGDGGIKRGTVTIVTGESGAGKTTICNNHIKNVRKLNKTIKIGFVSGEMNKLDWYEECEKNPNLKDIPVVFLRDYHKYKGAEYLAVLKKIFMLYDLSCVDSLAAIASRIVDATSMSDTEAIRWVLDVLNDLAEKELRSYLLVQHYSKGGNYIGPTKIKHDTTAMAFVMFDNAKNRYVIFDKNRRGGLIHTPLYFNMAEDGNIVFDEARLTQLLQTRVFAEKDKLDVTDDSLKFMEMISGSKDKDTVDTANVKVK